MVTQKSSLVFANIYLSMDSFYFKLPLSPHPAPFSSLLNIFSVIFPREFARRAAGCWASPRKTSGRKPRNGINKGYKREKRRFILSTRNPGDVWTRSYTLLEFHWRVGSRVKRILFLCHYVIARVFVGSDLFFLLASASALLVSFFPHHGSLFSLFSIFFVPLDDMCETYMRDSCYRALLRHIFMSLFFPLKDSYRQIGL